MPRTYDNWDRLVGATLRREELRLVSEIPSDLSIRSFSSSFTLSASSQRGSSFDDSGPLLGTRYTYDQIIKATDSLSESNLIKQGHSGDLYYGVLEGDIEVVVKKIDLSTAGKSKFHHYGSELEFLREVSHPRMVPLLGTCSDNIHVKFLVYSYMSKKDLSSYLYRKAVWDHDCDCSQFSVLDWRTRLKIAVGAAECLYYLHHKCVPPLAHSDVQSSSILLDDNFEPRLGSLSAVCSALTRVVEESRISKFFRLQSGNGRSSKGEANATCAYDVYCFGKVLFQLLTGRLHVDSAAGEETASPLCLANNWKDLMLQIYDEKRVRGILDPVLTVQEDVFLEVWAVALVALACLNPKPSRRPKMVQVLKGIKNRKISESFCVEMTRAIESHRTFLGPISPKFFK